MWVSLLRQAMANSLKVTIVTPTSSAQVSSVELLGKT
jgi:hypothetical protein